jgi:prepilin signal peptidase PulO-like enzyme (type II secretory pathway)
MEVLIVGIVGLASGHVVDLLWGRFYTGQPLRGHLYRCPGCKAATSPMYLLPFAGLLWKGARCPECGKALTLRSIYLPVCSALLYIVSWDSFGREVGAGLLGGTFATIFFTLALTDLETRLLPNRIIYPSIIMAAALSWGWPDTSVVEIFAGGGVGVLIAVVLLLLSIPFGSESFGLGDVKMIVLMGFVLGVPSVLVGVVIGTFAAGLAAAFLLITRLRTRKDYIPHGPFLTVGAIIALWWGPNIWDAYLR